MLANGFCCGFAPAVAVFAVVVCCYWVDEGVSDWVTVAEGIADEFTVVVIVAVTGCGMLD
jgi:hypothetical protein